jgi:hypothetical protein
MNRSATAILAFIFCLLGQVVLSYAAGGNICFSCGPTYCNGIDIAPSANHEQTCCCERCKEELPVEPRSPAKCCCSHAVPLANEHRRVEPVSTPENLLYIVAPIAVDDVASRLACNDSVERCPLCGQPPPLRTSDGITVTRLLI